MPTNFIPMEFVKLFSTAGSAARVPAMHIERSIIKFDFIDITYSLFCGLLIGAFSAGAGVSSHLRLKA
jgi:hypothetical protein